MSTLYGSQYKINYLNGTYGVAMGGTILDATLDPKMSLAQEAGSGEGRALADQKASTSKPEIQFTMNIRRLTDYLLSKAIISAEGAVPSTNLAVTDSVEALQLATKADKIQITIKTNGAIQAKVTALILGAPTSLPTTTFLFRTEKAMYKDALSTFTLAGTPITKWNQIDIEIDNNVLQECLGTSIVPTELQEQQANYKITFTCAKTGTSQLGNSLNGTQQTVVIALTDNESAPVTKTLTFANMWVTTDQVTDKELGIIYEKTVCEGASLVVS